MPKQIVHIGHIIHQVHQSYHNKTNKKLCRHKEAARCFVSDTVCIASIQNVERSLLLIVVSASDIPLRTIKLFSVLFGVFVHAAGRHKQTFAGVSRTARSTLHGRR